MAEEWQDYGQPIPENEWQDYNAPTPEDEWEDVTPEQSWGDWAVGMGLRTVPGVAGSIIGSFAGPVGTIAGGALGSAVGETLGEMYEQGDWINPEINPWQVGVQGGIGAIPLFGKTPGAGATAGEWLKYGAKAPWRGALEGAVIGGGAAFPTQWAETGELPSPAQVATGAAGGAAFGGATGYAFGRVPAKRIAAGIGEAPTPTPPSIGGMNLPDRIPITQFDAAYIAQLKALGYVPDPGARTPEGFPVMVKGGVTEPVTPPFEPPITYSKLVPVGEGAPVTLTNPSAFAVANMGKEGYVPYDINTQTGAVTFMPADQLPPGFVPPNIRALEAPVVKTADESITRAQEGLMRAMQAPEPIRPGLVGEADLFLPQEPGIPVTPDFPEGNMMDLTGRTIMTGERVRQLFRMEPSEAVRQGLVIQEAGGYRTTQPELPLAPTQPTGPEIELTLRSGEEPFIGPLPQEPTVPDLIQQNRLQNIAETPPLVPGETIELPPARILDFPTKPADMTAPEPTAINVVKKGATSEQSAQLISQWQDVVDNYTARINELDERNAPDFRYRDLLSTGARATLKRGETWRKKALQLVDYYNGMILKEGGVPRGQEPEAMRTGPRTGKISFNVNRAVTQLTKDYSGPLPGVMAREGMQNFFDNIKEHGGNGSVTINPNSLEISDTGSGMSLDEILTVYSDLFESGKATQEGATGGKGVGKAPYMLGGSHFEFRTVYDTGRLGGKKEYSFSGKPEELVEGFEVAEKSVPRDTPTGTWFKTTFKEGQTSGQADSMVGKILEFSRDLPGTILYTDNVYRIKGQPKVISSKANDKLMFRETVDSGFSDVEGLIPPNTQMRDGQYMDVHVLNHGMYQYTHTHRFNEEIIGIPDEIILDVKPKVPVTHDNYPFPIQRESLKEGIKKEIDGLIDRAIMEGARTKKMDLEALWQSIPVTGRGVMSGRELVFFDPGNRLTPDELKWMTTNPVVKSLNNALDFLVDDILRSSGNQSWIDRVERIGIGLFEDNIKGYHIPHPTTGKSAIMFNPSVHIRMNSLSPDGAALDMVVTGMHEAAHVGLEYHTSHIPLRVEDVNDPRVGKFLQTYIEQAMNQGGLNAGHSMSWLHRLGQVYNTFGTRKALNAADSIESIISNPVTRRYRPEIQEFLRIYRESRGRTATTEDILSGTGTQQAVRPTPEGSIPSNAGPTRAGTPAEVARQVEEEFKKLGGGKGGGTAGGGVGDGGGKKPPDPDKIPLLRQLWELSRSTTTVLDMSAPMRQGIMMAGMRNWRKAWFPMFNSAISQEAYDEIVRGWLRNENFQRTVNPVTGKFEKSFAEASGVKLTNLANKLTEREEGTLSQWAEKVPGIKRSNRAYNSFLNQLRVDSFTSLIKDAESAGLNPRDDMTLAKQIGEYVMVATGRGPLTVDVPTFGRGGLGKKTHSFEQAAGILTAGLFAPRLQFARFRAMNPASYIQMHPFVRKQYFKSALSTVGAWGTTASLASLAGATVSNDPTSSDFGKIRIGNTRIDFGAGYLQYLTLFGRLLAGGYTPSSTEPGGGQFKEFGTGYQAETAGSTMARFFANKLHPLGKFASDLVMASQYQPVYMNDRIVQAFIPMIIGDVVELAKEDPKLLPFVIPSVFFGAGTQTYEAGGEESIYIPQESDIRYTGGNPMRFMRENEFIQ